MIRFVAAAMTAVLVGARVLGAQGIGSITGTVRDTAGAPLAGAEVTLDTTRVSTYQQGAFRFDNVSTGQRFITIRMVGYLSLRKPLAVQSGINRYDLVLSSAIPTLPPVIVAARRTGVYGTVGDSALKPLSGVSVMVGGNHGGTALTDTSGRFSLPAVGPGQHVVNISHPGYAEERLFVEVKKDDGVELGIRLRPSRWPPSRAEQLATEDLGRRLALNMPSERLAAAQLDRYGSLGLCEVSRIGESIAKLIGRWPPAEADTALTIIVNGTDVLERMSVRALCSWKAAEVELVEFMPHVCRDVTRTLPDLLNVVYGLHRTPTAAQGTASWPQKGSVHHAEVCGKHQWPATGRTCRRHMGTEVVSGPSAFSGNPRLLFFHDLTAIRARFL
jgi:carboxypeptidase family protein